MNNTGDELQHNIVACSRNVYTPLTIRTEHPPPLPPIYFTEIHPVGAVNQMGMMEVIGALCHYENAPVNCMSTLLAQLSNIWIAVLVMEPISSLFLEYHNKSLHNSSTIWINVDTTRTKF